MGFLESSKDLSYYILTKIIAALACLNPQAIDRLRGLKREIQLLEVVVIADPDVGNLRDDVQLVIREVDLLDGFDVPVVICGKVLIVQDLIKELILVPEFLKLPKMLQDMCRDAFNEV